MGDSDAPGGGAMTHPHRSRLSRRAVAWARFCVGLMLIIAAAWVVCAQGESLRSAWASARAAPAWLVVAVLLMPMTSMVTTTTIFWLLTRRFGKVGWWEMSGLIGSAWLLNMLPFKPGLIGRVAYHKAISGIPVARSLLVVALAMLAGSVGIVITLTGVALSMPRDDRTPFRWLVVGGVSLCVVGVVVITQRVFPDRVWSVVKGMLWELGVCVLIRVGDTLLWGGRYFLALRLIGSPIDFQTCVIFAGVSQIAGQMPVQLGLREWTVGFASGTFTNQAGGASASTGISMHGVLPGLQADLVTRAAEIVCAVPVGVTSYVWLSRRLNALRQSDAATS